MQWLQRKKRVHDLQKSLRALEKSSRKRIVARGKRIAVQYEIPYTHKFNEKTYCLIEFETTKRDANNIARKERKAGILARGCTCEKRVCSISQKEMNLI